MTTAAAPAERKRPMTKEERKVILASSAGLFLNGMTFTCTALWQPLSAPSSSHHFQRPHEMCLPY